MNPLISPRGRSPRGAFHRLALFAAALGLLATAVAPAADTSAATPTQARLVVDAPSRVAVGQGFRIRLSVRDVDDLAGYEANLRYDAGAVTFRGVSQRRNGIRAVGRDVRALGPVERADGVTFGAYSCATDDCRTRRGVSKRTGRTRALDLATVRLSSARAGRLELRLAATRFVDADGRVLAVDTSAARRIVISVGGGADGIAAPAGAASLARSGTKRRTADVTGDGVVTLSDSLAVRSAWTRTREVAGSCSGIDGIDVTNEDVDGNGCVDVADVQSVTAAFSAPDTVRPTTDRIGGTRIEPGVLATWIVRSIGDAPDAGDAVDNTQDSPNGVCATTTGVCTLRAAIFEANRHVGPDRIRFAIPDAQATPTATSPTRVWRIQLTASNPLPTIDDDTGPLTIDGYTQPGSAVNSHALVSNARLKVEIRGPGEGQTAASQIHALEMTSSGNTVRGLAIYRVWKKLHLLESNDNKIIGNFLGTDARATYSYNVNHTRTAAVYMEDSAGNDVGGAPLASRNVVAGNQWTGIYTTGEAANGNRIRNNIVGLSPDGTRRLGNRVIGIDLNHGSSRNVVSDNVVSGNGREGIEVSHDETTADNELFGNKVGTDATGTMRSFTDFANGWDTTVDAGGVKIEDGAHGTRFHHNIVAGNVLNSILIMGGRTSDGVATEAHHNYVYDNRIGVGAGGEALPNYCPTNGLTCLLTGVRLQSYARGNRIGPGNEIAHFEYGVWIDGGHSDKNTVTRNSIHHNTVRGIELTPAGVDPNGSNGLPPEPSANHGVDHPMIAFATPQEVRGQACAGCTVEVFKAYGGANVYGQGELFVGSAVATPEGVFTLVPTGLASGDIVTATATDGIGNTSEFALDQRVRQTLLPPPGTRLAMDRFGRTVRDAWAAADLGGVYRIHTPSGSSASYDVGGGTGTMELPTPQTLSHHPTRAAMLASLSLMDIDAVTRVAFSEAPQGGDQYAYFVARQTIGGSEYRLRLRLGATGEIRVGARRFLDGAETAISNEVLVAGIAPSTTPLWMRVHVTGSAPTTLRMKVWQDGTSEPATWIYEAIDEEPRLQAPGPIGLRAYRESTTTNPMITVSWRDLYVRAADPALGLPDDFVPPTGSVVINGGAPATTRPIVSLDVTATDSASPVVLMRISSSPTMTAGLLTNAWETPYTTTVSWDLRTAAYGGSAQRGTRSVYVQWRDEAGNWSGIKTDTIVWE